MIKETLEHLPPKGCRSDEDEESSHRTGGPFLGLVPYGKQIAVRRYRQHGKHAAPAYKYAVRKKLCEHNPVSDVEKPKIPKKKRVDFLQPGEIRTLIKNAGDCEFETLYTLAAMSGMRQGEILGLKWTDIDWLNSQVHVRRTYNHGRFYEPKSETSRRAIDLGPSVIAALKGWRIACIPNELDLVFPNNVGKPCPGQRAAVCALLWRLCQFHPGQGAKTRS